MMPRDETSTPALAGRAHAAGWIVLWLLAAGVVTMLLAGNARLDTQLWLATRWAVGDGDHYRWAVFHAAHTAGDTGASSDQRMQPFYIVTPPPMESHFYKNTAWLWTSFKALGTFWAILVAAAAIGWLARPRWIAGGAAFLAMGVGNAPGLLAFIFGRDRPTHHDGANHWEFFRGLHDVKDLSFPSGHAIAAFSLAAVLAVYLPRTRWFMVPLAAACAVSRVVMEAHFYSDIIAGGVLGWTAGWFAAQAGRRLLARIPAGRGFPVIV